MGRTLHYKIEDNGNNTLIDGEWERISGLQHWYNSEFTWTCGKLGLKTFNVFPNLERFGDGSKISGISGIISQRYAQLQETGMSYKHIILTLEEEGYVTVKKGGYLDNCIASGFTKVVGNEWNAYLVCEFLLKCSILVPHLEIVVFDEGRFVKCKEVRIKDAVVRAVLEKKDQAKLEQLERSHRVFSIVNPSKYDHHPQFTALVFHSDDAGENGTFEIQRDHLGFADNYDSDGDDLEGRDLNEKAREFEWI
jgi:hypothetical protein